jgi:tRNA U34 5-methylaminomethyl-2-thiouridine-forming methyltransferase MnmC
MSIQIIHTSDGSHSLLNTELNETYHSQHGAVQESLHVFINHGLNYFLSTHQRNPVRVLEVGFGTGLNAFLTVQSLRESTRQIEYSSIEAFPLEQSIWSMLNYASTLADKDIFTKLHEAPWDTRQRITHNFELLKLKCTLQSLHLSACKYDVIYFDAFAPNKQPEMWELPVLEKVITALNVGGVFVTYCAKGQLKRDLKSLGLKVETLAGPPGKKEMVRALKI